MNPQPLLYRFDDRVAERWLILDRDGTLNRDAGYTHDPTHLDLLPGVVEALAALSASGWAFAIATNQAGLAKGGFTIAQMERFNEALIGRLSHDGVAVSGLAACPHHPHGTVPQWAVSCSCRKPNPGLLTALASQHGFTPTQAVFVGNSGLDEGAAAGAAMLFHWARNENDWVRIVGGLGGPR